MLVLKALNETGKLSMPDLQGKVGKDVAKIGMGNCMKKKWIKKDGGDLVPLKKVEEVEDELQAILKGLADANFAESGISDKVRLEIKLEILQLSNPEAHCMFTGCQRLEAS